LHHPIVSASAPAHSLALAVVLAVGLSSPAMADEDDGRLPGRAPANIAPVDAAIQTLQHDYPGRVLKVELERESERPSRWVYEVKILTDTGHVVELELDAVTLERLEVEGGPSARSHDD